MDDKKKGYIVGFFLGIIAALLAITMMALLLLPFRSPLEPPGCTGFSQVNPLAWEADSYGKSMQLKIFNDAGTMVHLNRVNIDMLNGSCSKDINKDLRAGESYEVNVSGCIIRASGADYKADINISYSNVASGINHSSSGECRGKVK